MRCTVRGCRKVNGVAATQATITSTIVAENTPKPTQLWPSLNAYMWFRLFSSPVMNTSATCMTMNSRNHTSTKKCNERATWMLSTLLTRVNRVDKAGDIPSPVSSASGAAMNTVKK